MLAWLMQHGIEMRLLTQPKLTEMAHRRVLSTMRWLTRGQPVSKASTAPAPRAMEACRACCGCEGRPG